MSADDGAGTREVARRLFAAEYDDATLSYSESDEERAPNYVVTPTGARVNRLFAVGVLTETESVNDDMLRARIVDPTGAFVAYAGQYQPEALAFFERATPPAFVALTAKARTFQPDDSEQVFTSARPETVNEVDADTRDRWTVSAAEATLRRVSLFDAALSSGLRGDELEAHLRRHGVEEALAAGIPRAIDHYGTTTAYLDAVRQLALDALAVVAGEREEVRELSLSPDEGGAAALGQIPSSLRADEAIATPDPSAEPTSTEGADAATSAEESAATGASEDSPDAPEASEATAEEAVDADSDVADDLGSFDDSLSEEVDAGADAAPDDAGADATADDAGADATADADGTVDADATGPDAAGADAAGADATGAEDPDATADATGATEESAASSDPEEAPADPEEPAQAADVADDELYEFDEEEREAVREEHGLSFESGAEVGSPGEAGIETPDVDEIEAEMSAEGSADSAGASSDVAEPTAGEETPSADAGSTTEPSGAAGDAAADEADAATAEATTGEAESTDVEAGSTDAEAESTDVEADPVTGDSDDGTESTAPEQSAADDDAADADLSDVVVDVMDELDDGDGADREKVVAAVVQRSGADPGAAEDAIQEALMDGKCYEPGEGRLKAI